MQSNYRMGDADREEKHEKPQYDDHVPTYDDPFGNEEFAEVQYRTLHWW